jgi:four helix bundle protein
VAYRHFTQMPVWQRGHVAVLLVYKLSGRFPEAEKYALTSQMRRAAVSITSNIAEAFGRLTSKDKVRFYLNARGSCYEVQSQAHAARDLDYLTPQDFTELDQSLNEIVHDLNKIMKTLSGGVPKCSSKTT